MQGGRVHPDLEALLALQDQDVAPPAGPVAADELPDHAEQLVQVEALGRAHTATFPGTRT